MDCLVLQQLECYQVVRPIKNALAGSVGTYRCVRMGNHTNPQ